MLKSSACVKTCFTLYDLISVFEVGWVHQKNVLLVGKGFSGTERHIYSTNDSNDFVILATTQHSKAKNVIFQTVFKCFGPLT